MHSVTSPGDVTLGSEAVRDGRSTNCWQVAGAGRIRTPPGNAAADFDRGSGGVAPLARSLCQVDEPGRCWFESTRPEIEGRKLGIEINV